MGKITMEHKQTFADWLNRIDATISYDRRRKIPLLKWHRLFQAGYSGFDAVQACFSPEELMG
jgi:hypothetical protein